MNYIVFVGGDKHSAWTSKQEAVKQISVLVNSGYRNCHYDQIDHSYENGHYFI